ncbi:hypothetical protein LJR267_010701 [Paraburkholderia hospita]|uniref:hypothetical protein n=1 Tax=Paraburkholderia hospita TaxID=169430 RepID=UPI003ECE3FE7
MLDRIRYFTGRHMTARDFRDADDYHRSMRHLHNRMLHGWGVACGLEVTAHPRPECGIVVQCGLAIDCCGREIVVPAAVSRRVPWDQLPKTQNGTERDKDYLLVLCLQYCEVLTEKVPVLYSNEACSSASYEDGRVRESYAIHWHAVKEADLEQYGWQLPTGCAPGADPPPCDTSASACCLEPDCPRDGCVALAVVRGDETTPAIDTTQRRFIGATPEHLTHICWISWTHGGYMSASQLSEVSVRFDRPLAEQKDNEEAGPVGINERTFVMQAGEQREDLDFVMFNKVPHRLPDGRTVVHDVVRPEQYIGHTIQVTLRCDFILDCHGNPVDGTHLRGRLPTGNGVVGGDFQSWFRVVSDDDYKRLTAAANTAGATP